MRSNGLLKWLMIPMLLLLVFVGIKLFSGRGATPPSSDASSRLTPEEAKALGIEGDTPRDTVATLVAQVRQLRTELQTALSDNKTQREENTRLRQRESSIDRRIQSALESGRSQLREDREQVAGERQRTQGLLQELQQRLDGIGGSKGKSADLPVGLGLEPEDGEEILRWVEPDDTRGDDKHRPAKNALGSAFPTSFGPAQKTLETETSTALDVGRQAAGVPETQAVYTVPTNATLIGSIAMTALIGRVPVDGTVNDPYPFKILIGPDNLTANGIDLPDVAGAVISGTASGDWTLSCVRGQVRSVTFVFQDGTIRSIPEEHGRNTTSQRTENNGTSQNGLGWISDPYGIPCVSGERRSNAQQYLGSQALITAAGAGVASLLDTSSSQVSYVNSNGAIGTVGIGANEAMGRILAGGVQDMSQWVNKLYGQAFAAVYVKPGARVAVHLEDPLLIDYDPAGRRVDHRLGGTPHAQDLD
ncbi:TIGR03752 family integrating conjugative element protein [Pseudomonas citronellolis]|uniref:TIGR03752 family integrating conjugative element protein n=1 Tax=Pseudomonas citronellolis TaxID=53408 RepID=UPI0021BF23E9|nr:TIGR03752 family integrating conjugative element protein [Pseudomonas citronellolis]UXJ50136.1 TIGR03752 family integrating conjugative element protein [Pseudomonas citronellolis]